MRAIVNRDRHLEPLEPLAGLEPGDVVEVSLSAPPPAPLDEPPPSPVRVAVETLAPMGAVMIVGSATILALWALLRLIPGVTDAWAAVYAMVGMLTLLGVLAVISAEYEKRWKVYKRRRGRDS